RASLRIPAKRIKTRNNLQNATYSDKLRPKIVIVLSQLLFLLEILFQLPRLFDGIARTEILQFEQLTKLDLRLSCTVRIGCALGPFDRLFLRLRLDQPIPGNQFLRLSERAVDDGALFTGKLNP